MNRLRKSLFESGVAIVVMAGVIVAVAGLWFWSVVYQERPKPEIETDVIVPRGSSFGAVTQELADDGVIAHRLPFLLLARLRHVDTDVKAGEYRFPPHQTLDEVLRKLVEGGAQIAAWVTIPEGYTAAQIANDLAAHDLGRAQSYRDYFARRTIVLGGVRTKGLEGYLFPSTYLFPLAAPPSQAAKILVDEFRRELPADAESKARRLGYTLPQVVTLASLIEREAKADDERALMAGVYYNRLRKGMPLEVDATIEYIFPEHKTEITRADLQIESPYNTYKHVGLPPTPIANPGRASLLAALNPQPSDYYFYVYKGNGHHAFARTLEEHNANVSRYLR
ncbi:MAG: endolytic transglycosylase MltG [Candidatus Eremiobacteraeota bacterium]|nr:endolytic transglycosylase MltG [Candidatus Eremiobacteraeota bacterium]